MRFDKYNNPNKRHRPSAFMRDRQELPFIVESNSGTVVVNPKTGEIYYGKDRD